MSNQRNVAARAGLSSATVSRYLADPDSVSPQAARAISDAIAALDYRLDTSAKALCMGKSHHIAVLSPESLLAGRQIDGVLMIATEHPSDDETIQRLGQFYVAQASTDTAATLNAALAAGKRLLLTPGVYSLNGTLQVTKANTVVLGLGIATLLNTTGVPAMQIADVDGVEVAGLLFDAGPTSASSQLLVGPSGSSASHASNPTALSDLFFRVGGAAVGKTSVSLQINSSNVIGDDFWIWRADHGASASTVGWTVNTAANVTVYGLAVAHYQQYQTLWNGNGGQVYFYQSEEPYDVPSQSAWMNGTANANGYSSYKVANTVTSHSAYGVGVYCYFNVNPAVQLDNAFEVPTAGLNGVMMHDLTTVSLGGLGTISHILDGYGAAVNSTTQLAALVK